MADGAPLTGMMATQRARDLLQRHAAMESERYNFESQWNRVASLIDPSGAQFNERGTTQGQRRDQFQFDATGSLALPRFAAAVESLITPRTQKWCKLVSTDKRLRDNIVVQRYLDEVNDILFEMRYAPSAGFTTATQEYYISLGAYGSGAVTAMDDLRRGGIRYQAQYLGDVWFGVNFQGEIDTIHRKFEWDARQAYQRFGDGPNGEFKKNADRPERKKYEFLHCVCPEDDYDERYPSKRMQWRSEYVCVPLQTVVESGGYYTKPIIAGRFSTSPRETYGRGPAMMVLNTLNTANEMQKTMLRAGQKAVDPPLLLPDDDVLRGFNLRSGALNYGGLDDNGQPRVVPLQTGANLPIGLEMLESERRVINDAFLVTLFQILVDSPQMTATEALLRSQEKGALLAPPMGRQQTEFLGPLIQRELDIASRQSRLPPMPDVLRQAGGMVDVEYTAPVNQLQKSDDAVAIIRTLESVTPMAQIDPSVLDGFRVKEMARVIAKANGVPAIALATEDEMAEKDASRAQAAQAQQLLAAAPVASQSALNIAKAQEAGLSTPDVSTLLQGA